MRFILHLFLLLSLSCASITLPDGTTLKTTGKAEAVVLDRSVPAIIPFSGRIVSELVRNNTACPYLRRQYYNEQDKMINEEFIPLCKYYVKSSITVWDFLEMIFGMWLTAAGFP